ncbi:MAG: hypothetical protein ABR95_11090 [Sphingobacteriales bacterium BACL12 MAG-120813-bin55]|nr:MAG: hypothetical protein ABR94_00375 [Sphingobacteriales bacterium BACL12 MAG-120802-bin5]KRP13193.1 MAG: hypothetical protein ABR95_11090 [Sphingobacteriales bacterium BACL12 MAG-120813-bin55]
MELLQSDKEVEQVLLQAASTGEAISAIRKICSEKDIPVKTVPPEKLSRLTGGNHQGVIAFTSPVRFQQLEDIVQHTIEQGEAPLILLLDHITDMGNFGAICRTAWAAGVHAIVIPTSGAAPVNGDAIKASAGALQMLPVCRVARLEDALDYLRLNGLLIIGAAAEGNTTPAQTDFSIPCAIVMGSEDEGISPGIRPQLTATVAIPMQRPFDSYNVSVACGMLLYECMRQRQ